MYFQYGSTSDRLLPRRLLPIPFGIGFAAVARACRDHDQGRLTPRERAFVASMVALGFNEQPSSRQCEWLAMIFMRLHGRVAA